MTLPYVVTDDGQATAMFANADDAEAFAVKHSILKPNDLFEIVDSTGQFDAIAVCNGSIKTLKYKAVFSGQQWRVQNTATGKDSADLTMAQAKSIARLLNGLPPLGWGHSVWCELLAATKDCLTAMDYVHMDNESIEHEITLGNQQVVPIKRARAAVAAAEVFLDAKFN